jgi:hypothetical protein
LADRVAVSLASELGISGEVLTIFTAFAAGNYAVVSEGFTVVPTEVIRGPQRYLNSGPLLAIWQFRDPSDALVTASSPRGHLAGVRLHGP